jgi:hypothetical protein
MTSATGLKVPKAMVRPVSGQIATASAVAGVGADAADAAAVAVAKVAVVRVARRAERPSSADRRVVDSRTR